MADQKRTELNIDEFIDKNLEHSPKEDPVTDTDDSISEGSLQLTDDLPPPFPNAHLLEEVDRRLEERHRLEKEKREKEIKEWKRKQSAESFQSVQSQVCTQQPWA